MKKCIFLSISLFFFQALFAQKEQPVGAKIEPLKVGDTIPEDIMLHMLNFPSASASFSSFKGKPLILDFWSLGCSSCILSWPHLKELQKQVGNQMQILLVNPFSDLNHVRQLFEKRKKLAGVDMDLPCSCGDSILLKYFSISGVPQEYWVNSQGVIEYITWIGSLKIANLTGFIKGAPLNMPQLIQNDDYISRDPRKPLYMQGNGGDPQKVYWQSLFAKADPKLSPGVGIGEYGKASCYALGVGCIRDLYALAYNNGEDNLGISDLPPNRIALEVSDSTKYLNLMNGEYYSNNNYAYQLITPLLPLRQVQQLMQKDLENYIGLKVHWEKRKKKCLVLTAKDTFKLQYKEGRYISNMTYDKIDINKIPVSLFVELLAERYYNLTPYPVMDETNYKGLLKHITVETDITSLQELNKDLANYGLELKLQDRMVDILVLSESEVPNKLGFKE